MKLKDVIFLIFVFSIFYCSNKETTTPNEEIPADIQWLKDNVIPFETEMPGNGFDDLMPLKNIIGDARIVALGETSHGTRECFLMKHRLLEFLAEEMGFNTFAMEASFTDTWLINEYLINGFGNASEALANMSWYWMWQTQEVLDMVVWMRSFNENNSSKLSFYGFDPWNIATASQKVSDYLKTVDPEISGFADSLFNSLEDNLYSTNMSETEKNILLEKHNILTDRFENKKDLYISMSSEKEYLITEKFLRIVWQHCDVYWSTESVSGENDPIIYRTRDSYMAKNVEWIIEEFEPNSKIVLWAHNFHVSTQYPSMGYNLKQKYGDDMVIFGMTFFEGSFNTYTINSTSSGISNGPVPYQAPAVPEDSYAYYFHKAGIPKFFLNFNIIDTSLNETAWFNEPHFLRSLDASYKIYDPGFYLVKYKANDYYDVMIYFDTTTPSTLLPN